MSISPKNMRSFETEILFSAESFYVCFRQTFADSPQPAIPSHGR